MLDWLKFKFAPDEHQLKPVHDISKLSGAMRAGAEVTEERHGTLLGENTCALGAALIGAFGSGFGAHERLLRNGDGYHQTIADHFNVPYGVVKDAEAMFEGWKGHTRHTRLEVADMLEAKGY